MRRARHGAALLLAAALTAGASLGVTFADPAAAATATESAVTKSGSGDFSSLKVTVAQTRNLVDQVVEVSWTGGKRTTPGSGQFAVNYLQIMQCWGDAADGPSREQCQFGGLTGDLRGGPQTSTRQVNYGDQLVDPLETIKVDPKKPLSNVYVPFRSVDGEVSASGVSDKFDAYSTNEVPYAVTRADGTGQDFFSMQTAKDAPGLGCGSPVTRAGRTVGRSCWLVVVPRGDTEVDGKPTPDTEGRLISSPLSASNWKNRIVVPLQFELVGRPCPLGKAERRTTGQEAVAEAVLRWQPSLCAGDGAVFGYSQISDDAARRELLGADPGLTYLSRPLAAAQNPEGREVLYAPVALSGLTVAYNVEQKSPGRAPADVKARDGQRITSLRLTPRLVAKLLTQSYQRAVDVESPSVQGNPADLLKDPEFQALNPRYDGLTVVLYDLLLPVGRSDAIEQAWRWIKADNEAAAFIAGTPDPWGMKVNPYYKAMPLPRDDYPKNDPYCRTFLSQPPLCTLDAHPYAADQHDAARAASRGDTLGRVRWDTTAEPPAYKASLPQPSGERGLLALVDTASAARYGLETAELRNAQGEFVAPTVSALRSAAIDFSAGSDPSVLEPASRTTSPDAYPLAALTYAATVPSVLEKAAREDYAALLDYAAGAGQTPGVQPGTLPYGYAPLPTAMRQTTVTAATALRKGEVPAAPTDDDGDASSPSGSSAGAPTGAPGGFAAGPAGGAGTGALPGAPSDPSTVALVSLATPTGAAGAGRLVPLLALAVGIAAAVVGPVLLQRARAVPPRAT